MFTGSYTLSASEVADNGGGDPRPGPGPEPILTDDYAGDTSTTGSLTVGGSVSGEIETYGDSDWFAISLQDNSVYSFEILFDVTESAGLGLNGLTIYTSDGLPDVSTTIGDFGTGETSFQTSNYLAEYSGIYY